MRRLTAVPLLLLVACGGGSPTPPPPPPPTYPVEAVVFYDENGDGLQGGNEVAVVPGVDVEIQGHVASTVPGTGRATVTGVLGGSWAAQIRPDSLPPFYQAGPSVQVSVPVADGQPVRLPATLPIGPNHPSVYMAFGDSITDGDGSSDEAGYRARLQAKLVPWFGAGTIVNQGIGGTRSESGVGRIGASLSRIHPAYSLILYGTNDWNDLACREEPPCFTITSLRSMVRSVKARQGLPVLSTIIPVNTGYDARTPPSRNEWTEGINGLIKAMAAEEGAALADPYTAFMAVPDFHSLFFDHVHPNDAGYEILATAFFKAITEPPAPAASEAALPALFPPRGYFPEAIPDDPADVPRPPRWPEGGSQP